MEKINRVRVTFDFDSEFKSQLKEVTGVTGLKASDYFVLNKIASLYLNRRWASWSFDKDDGTDGEFIPNKDIFEAHLGEAECNARHFKSKHIICEFTYW